MSAIGRGQGSIGCAIRCGPWGAWAVVTSLAMRVFREANSGAVQLPCYAEGREEEPHYPWEIGCAVSSGVVSTDGGDRRGPRARPTTHKLPNARWASTMGPVKLKSSRSWRATVHPYLARQMSESGLRGPKRFELWGGYTLRYNPT